MENINLYEKITPMEKNFPIKIKRARREEYVALHWHEHMEILYFISGNCNVVCGGEAYSAKAGDTIVINSNELHYTDNNGEADFFCIHITPDFFADIDFSDVLFRTYVDKDCFIADSVERMYLENCAREAGYDMRIKGTAYLLMAHMVSNYKADELSESDVVLRKNRLNRIGEILNYISKNYHTKLTTIMLADRFHLTEHYFCSLFKKETGQSPINYINGYRIQKAAILLKNTDQSITEIAMNVGFEDSNYFARCFKKHFGISAREYRRQA